MQVPPKRRPPRDRIPAHPRRTLLAGLLAAPLAGVAQSARPLRIVVPFTPGGSTDILARALAPRLAAALGQGVVVDNRPGAGGSLGAAEAARAEPDGHTLLMGHIGTLAVNPALYPKLGYDPLRSFVPVAFVARVPNVLVVNASAPWRRLKDLLDAARAQPGRLTYSSGGNGSAAHITAEFLKLRAQVFLLHIPYRGTAPSVADLIAGQVDCTFTGAPAVLPHVKSGRLRALAVSSAQRLATLPEVPTVAESGYAGFEAPVVRPGRPGRHAGGAGDTAERRGQPGARAARGRPATGRRRGAADAGHTAGVRGTDPARDPALGRGGEGRERQA